MLNLLSAVNKLRQVVKPRAGKIAVHVDASGAL